MAIVLTNDENYKAIAKAIRGQTGEIEKLLPEQMAEEIDNIPNYAQSVVQEVSDARTGYDGIRYNNLDSRIDGDINNLLEKTNTVNYKDTTINANNTIKRNLVANRNKVEVLGQTIQNCLDHSSGLIYSPTYVFIYTKGFLPNIFPVMKDKTKYTVIVSNVSFIAKLSLCQLIDSNGSNRNSDIVNFNKTNKAIITTDIKNPLTNNILFIGLTETLTESERSEFSNMKVMILEGDWTSKEVSYVPFGLNYPETTEVVECGKNLFDVSKIPTIWNGSYGIKNNGDGTIYIKNSPTSSGISTKLKLKEICPLIEIGKTYILNFENDTSGYKRIYLFETKYAWNTNTLLTITEEHLNSEVYLYSSQSINTEATLSNFQIEEAEVATEYEPYTERKVNINYHLASVSDTIRDIYYVKDGKKYHKQNVKEIVFDGSDDEVWRTDSAVSNYYHVEISDLKEFSKLLCDKAYYAGRIPNQLNQCYATTVLVIGCDRSLYPTATEFKNYLKTNPYTFLYELSTPITTEIETEDMQSFDGQTNITTTNTVKPTLDIDIPSDLTAVVSNLMVENSSLQAENQALTNELENQASSIESQKANMDYISMMTGVDL